MQSTSTIMHPVYTWPTLTQSQLQLQQRRLSVRSTPLSTRRPTVYYLHRWLLATYERPMERWPLATVQSVSRILVDCFDRPIEAVGFSQPSITYTLSIDTTATDVVATVTESDRLPSMPIQVSRRVAPYRNVPIRFLSNVCVSSAYRRGGVARQLLEYLFTIDGPTTAYLLQVLTGNEPAKRLYTRLHFFPMDVRSITQDGQWFEWWFRPPLFS